MILWKLAYRNLFRNRRRTLATLLALTSGFVGLLLLGGYISRAQKGLMGSAIYINMKGHISIYKTHAVDMFQINPKKNIITSLQQEKVNSILNKYSDKIDFYGPFLSGSGLIINNEKSTPVLMTAFNPDVFRKAMSNSFVIKWAKDWVLKLSENVIEKEDEISVTPRLSQLIGKDFFWKMNSSSDNDVQIIAKTYQSDLNAVSAKLKSAHSTGVVFLEDTSLFLPITLLQNLLNTDGVQNINIFLKDVSDTNYLVKKIKQDIKDENMDLEVFSFNNEKISSFYVGTMSFLYVMGGFFVVLICSAIILAIINSLTMGILERSQEVGSLRALGFELKTVISIFIRESIILTSVSVILGLIVSKFIQVIIFSQNIRFAPPGVQGDIQFMLSLDLWLILLILISFLIVTTATAYFVSNQLLRKKIIHLLQQTNS